MMKKIFALVCAALLCLSLTGFAAFADEESGVIECGWQYSSGGPTADLSLTLYSPEGGPADAEYLNMWGPFSVVIKDEDGNTYYKEELSGNSFSYTINDAGNYTVYVYDARGRAQGHTTQDGYDASPIQIYVTTGGDDTPNYAFEMLGMLYEIYDNLYTANAAAPADEAMSEDRVKDMAARTWLVQMSINGHNNETDMAMAIDSAVIYDSEVIGKSVLVPLFNYITDNPAYNNAMVSGAVLDESCIGDDEFWGGSTLDEYPTGEDEIGSDGLTAENPTGGADDPDAVSVVAEAEDGSGATVWIIVGCVAAAAVVAVVVAVVIKAKKKA